MKKYTAIIITAFISILIGTLIMASVNALSSPKEKRANALKQFCLAQKKLGAANLHDIAFKLGKWQEIDVQRSLELSELNCF